MRQQRQQDYCNKISEGRQPTSRDVEWLARPRRAAPGAVQAGGGEGAREGAGAEDEHGADEEVAQQRARGLGRAAAAVAVALEERDAAPRGRARRACP